MVRPVTANFNTDQVITSLENKNKKDINKILVNLIKLNKKNASESFQSIISPDRLKVGKITPIYYKSGSKIDISHYRPISILPIFSKIFEALMKKENSQWDIH